LEFVKNINTTEVTGNNTFGVDSQVSISIDIYRRGGKGNKTPIIKSLQEEE